MAALGLQKPEQIGRSFADDIMRGIDKIGDGLVNGIGMFLDNMTAMVRGAGKRSVGDMFHNPNTMKSNFNPHARMGRDNPSPKVERKPKERSLERARGQEISPQQAQKFNDMLSKYGMDKDALKSMVNPNQVAGLKDKEMVAQMKTQHQQPMRFEISNVEDSYISSAPVVGVKRHHQQMAHTL